MNIRTIKRRVFALALLAIPAIAADISKDYRYLALGDSIPFGLDVSKVIAAFPNFPDPDVFVGYPEVLADVVNARHVNASCPGETAASFLDSSKPDLGCNSEHLNPPPAPPFPPFKIDNGAHLHTPYTGAQMAFAMGQLDRNKNINLITLSIGGNDLLRLLNECNNDPSCVGPRLPGMLNDYGRNLATILTILRSKYKRTIVLMQYHSPFPTLDPLVIELNKVIADVGKGFDVKLADGFKAFKLASIRFGGDPCKAGLDNMVPTGPTTPPTCDVHPSRRGQQVLAISVGLALLQ